MRGTARRIAMTAATAAVLLGLAGCEPPPTAEESAAIAEAGAEAHVLAVVADLAEVAERRTTDSPCGNPGSAQSVMLTLRPLGDADVMAALAADWATLGDVEEPAPTSIAVESDGLRLRANDYLADRGTIEAFSVGPCYGPPTVK